MGLFSKIFGRFEPRHIELTDLGAFRSTRHGTWNGHLALPGHEAPIPVILAGAPEPPSDAQHAFLLELRGRFEELEAAMARTLFEGIDPLDDGSSPEQVFAHMRLLRLHIPADASPPATWELSYEHTQDQGEHLFTVHMLGWEHQGFSMDG